MAKNLNKLISSPKKKAISQSMLLGSALFVLGLISLFTGHIAADIEFSRLNRRWRSRRGVYREPVNIWKSEFSNLYYGCSDRGPNFRAGVHESRSNGYLLIASSGGLNQQRTGVCSALRNALHTALLGHLLSLNELLGYFPCILVWFLSCLLYNQITDAVVVARILNATLVIPELDHDSFWKDNSEFFDIFDVDWFISSLSKDVTVVKRIPDKVMRSMEKPPYTMRPPRKSTPEYYLDVALPVLLRRRALQLTKFDYRLASILDEEMQKLRCRVNYLALRFTKPIQGMGQMLVDKMRMMSSRFIAIHLRFEPDMLAFSGCYYGGGEKELKELGEIRKRWSTLPDLSAEDERSRGKCPLTPFEVGLMLRALGFGNDTYIYVASGEIYGGEETLRPLRDLFPNLYTKEILAGDNLRPFIPFLSRLAAIDYIVCDESDVFVTNNNGNMAKILAGRRRYMGHKRTIRPNAKKLSSLFRARHQMKWENFARKVKSCQRGFLGEPDEMRPGRGEFHEFPYSCICHSETEPEGLPKLENGEGRLLPKLTN